MQTLIKYQFTLVLSLVTFIACKNQDRDFDASGSFEAKEYIISAEATGILRQFEIEEGQQIKSGQHIGYIDTTQLFLKKKQLQAQIKAGLSKKPNVDAQLASLQSQLATAEREQKRVVNLVKADAATPKQLDDANAQIEVLHKQIAAQKSSLDISSGSISNETVPLQVQIEQLNDQLLKSYLINPVEGTVLTKYAEQSEMTAAGKPLYKIADLSVMILRAYITGDQLAAIHLDQAVKVFTDDGLGGFKETEGIVTWISPEAEFTPKTIQTKNERANKVYAIKVSVKNDGTYKIGMYGEVNL